MTVATIAVLVLGLALVVVAGVQLARLRRLLEESAAAREDARVELALRVDETLRAELRQAREETAQQARAVREEAAAAARAVREEMLLAL